MREIKAALYVFVAAAPIFGVAYLFALGGHPEAIIIAMLVSLVLSSIITGRVMHRPGKMPK